MLGNVASIVMSLIHSSLNWNGVMYPAIVLVLCYVPMVTSTVYDVINYRHRMVQVAIYSIPYLFHQGCIMKCVCINYCGTPFMLSLVVDVTKCKSTYLFGPTPFENSVK